MKRSPPGFSRWKRHRHLHAQEATDPIVAFVVALVASDIAVRFVQRMRGAPYDSGAAREQLEHNLAAALGKLAMPGANEGEGAERFFLHPYFGWDSKID